MTVSVMFVRCEVTLATPSSLMAKEATWSNHKHNNNEILHRYYSCWMYIILPKGWGGKVIDKTVMEKCGIPENLVLGNIIL